MGARDVLTTISNWMSGLRKAVMANHLKVGTFAAIAGFVTISLIVLTFEAMGHFSGALRAVLLAIWALTTVAALGLGVLWPILRYTVFAPDDKKLAGEYAARIPEVKDRVLNALQLLDRVDGANAEGYSPDLILEAGRSVAEELQPIDPKRLPDNRPVKRYQKFALAAVGLAMVVFAIGRGSLLSAGERVLKPGEEFAPPAPFTLAVRPGDVQLVRGDSLVVEIYASGAMPQTVTLERQETGKNVSEPVELKFEDRKSETENPNSDSGQAETPASADGSARYVYRGITAPFTYWASSGTVKSEKYKVSVQELPSVKFLSLRVTPPAYTGLEEQVLEENVGDVAALVGTQVKLSLAATKTLKSARMEFFAENPKSEIRNPNPENGGEANVVPHGSAPTSPTEVKALAVDGSRANGEFAIRESGYYQIRLVDQEGFENRDPILYRVIARKDELPLITIVDPSQDADIAANIKLPVVTEAMDDYGFTRMQLRYHRTSAFESPEEQENEANYQTLPLDYKLIESGKAMGEYIWDLTPLDLLPEDQVMFFTEVWDNDRITGPKRARSETRTLRYPSMAEMFNEQEKQAEAQEISLEDLLKESKEIREKVEEAVEEFKSNPDMSWERKQEIEKLMDKQKAMNEMLSQISEAMEQASQQMEQRAMFSPEVMEKMEKIRQLAQEVITPEMREALKKMAEAMKQPSEEEMRKAMENMQRHQELFEQALDQTLNMLEQLKIEKKLDELTRRLDELGRQQEQMGEKLDQNKDAKQNAEEQKKLADEMKKIEEEMKKLAQEMQEKQMKAADKMQQMEKKSEEEKLSEQMKENSEQMKSGTQQSMCKKKSKSHRRKMSEMANELQNIKNQMNQDEDQEALEKLERSRDQLLDLSMRQEKLWKESENLEAGSPQQAQAAEEQENLRQAMQRVQEDLKALAKESMHVSPKLSAAMSEAMAQMMQASQASAERDPRTASHYRKQSLAAINNALKENQSSCSSCKSSCNKPNPNSSCNKAGQMASQQRKIGEGTKEMMGQTNPGSLSMGEQAGMQRMAVEQRALAKSARELAEEAKASQQSLGKLDDIAGEMEEVAKDLENRNVTERTLEKQDQIENRLLDFQRANREREFSPMRQSNTGVDVVRVSPKEIPDKPGKDQLREDLLRALDAKYTPDYENLIRSYFDALGKLK